LFSLHKLTLVVARVKVLNPDLRPRPRTERRAAEGLMNLDKTVQPRITAEGSMHVVRGPFGRTREEIEEAAMRTGPWPLTDDHWRVIQFVRAYARDNKNSPALVRVARVTGFRLKHLEQLFPRGVVRTVLQLVGLDLPLDLHSCCPFATPTENTTQN